MESLPGVVYVLGPDHSIRYANRAFKRYFGAHGNRPCHTVIRGRDGPCRVCPPFESLHRQERVSAEWTNQEDGKTFQIHCHPMTDVDGEVVVIVLGVDITARKQAEEELRQAHDELEQRVERRTAELRESEARFRAVVEDQTELICRLDAEGRVEFANTAYCRFFGVEREELRGRPMDMDVLEEDEPLFRSLFRGLRPEEPVHAGEFRVVVPSGESLRMGWLRWTIRGLFDGQGALQGYPAVGRDVTGRKAAEQRYHDLIQSLPVVVFALDQDLSLDFLNSTSQELLGYAPEEALDRPGWLLERVAAEDREQVRDFLEQAMAPGSDPESLEFRFEHSKGYRVHLLASPIPQSRLRNGGEPRVEGILMDVSDRSFLDKVLVQREKLNTLGAMSAELAHEIRNPLMSLGGYARRLQTKHPELPEAAIVLEEAERLEQLLERISEYLKPMRVERVPCQVNAILRFCMDHLVGHLGRRGVSTNLDLEQELSPVPADPDLLTQVFISLVTSLSDRMDRDGLLTVRTYETRQNVGVDFVVRPKTFPIANPELLFLPFEEEKDAFNLALSYRLMKNIGGFLSYEDADEAHVFTVSLPKEPMAE
jgi:PAS domain S-box-containing protein